MMQDGLTQRYSWSPVLCSWWQRPSGRNILQIINYYVSLKWLCWIHLSLFSCTCESPSCCMCVDLPATVGREADPASTPKRPCGPGTDHDESHGWDQQRFIPELQTQDWWGVCACTLCDGFHMHFTTWSTVEVGTYIRMISICSLSILFLKRYSPWTFGFRGDWRKKATVWHMGRHCQHGQSNGVHWCSRKDTGVCVHVCAHVHMLYINYI